MVSAAELVGVKVDALGDVCVGLGADGKPVTLPGITPIW